MSRLPDRQQQIITMHAPFIRQLVQCSQDPARQGDVETLLRTAAENGWDRLVAALRAILVGQRDVGVLRGLDEEDRVIAEAVLRGLQNPATLPEAEAKADPAMAAPGLASMIRAAASGNVQALKIISDMAEQMRRAGGPMARLAAAIRPLINGERDPQRLAKGMDGKTEQLLLSILKELGKLEHH
jgi:hypothetical protein